MEKPLSLADIRINYSLKELTQESVAQDPLQQFGTWMEEALAAKADEPTAMTLSTATAQGRPTARVVLLKALEKAGFVFYTNYESRKGQQLQENPFAALTFFWPSLERQVRIEGTVERVPEEMSDAYFQSRPRGSQIGAWSSPQSQPIPDRFVLQHLEQEYTAKFKDQEVLPRPSHWGGYLVRPQRIEFWQGRQNRLHDRLLYELESSGNWRIQRLAP
ncbi:pyridoxamine 5'-phosphate oxidase [Rufibacter glacialis]|uniref:Pyridoxine/pyridoxamine 5'-phosphate oxidase n=1 Tax=Rufibacter glacialis TaxID=1259555 RepID=A0A5M8QH52_9BACT|nr:pyridoxamine 5'-phosphate oxidase [Rufibacter glacialis]KAA6434260.1 pyridoxamine 5'-phosphate oxidase [Rufibacter glacialis]GGK68117.1 pyridoxine/pyridoxamine 5'-phosphate oxidase [Rufibacter glacialis]